MNEQEIKELFDVLIVETRRQRRIVISEKEKELVRKYDEENVGVYDLIVDYVETWFR